MNPRRYVGGWGVSADADDELLYMRARYQDSELGVFISRDPIGLRGGLNLYGYVDNNPVKYVDSLGEAIQWPSLVRSVVVGYLVNDWFTSYNKARESARGNDCWQDDPSRANCLQHCIASCDIARKYGDRVAEFLGMLAELFAWNPDSEVDYSNNALGRALAERANSFAGCEKLCSTAADQGLCTPLPSRIGPERLGRRP